MTPQEIRQKANTLENDIKDLIFKFTKETGQSNLDLNTQLHYHEDNYGKKSLTQLIVKVNVII
jgi:hypothetical protein